jgi:hypothetical protein
VHAEDECLGYRLLCQSILPVNKDTICYGSNDYARTIHNDNSEFEQCMKRASQILNLKSHTNNSVTLYSAVDMGNNIMNFFNMFNISLM